MRMQLATWPEVETYLKTSAGIILPIGSTEQHGPTGFIGTDALTAEIISIEVGERVGAWLPQRFPLVWHSTTLVLQDP